MNSKTIVRNTAWYGVENVISFATSLVTSILIARHLGPTRMGYLIYVMWLTNIAQQFGSIGIPVTTRKYMAEFLGAGDGATARYIFRHTFWMQTAMAVLATGGSLLWVLHDAPAADRWAAALLVASILPQMINAVVAQANVAAEQMWANVPASAAATIVFFVLILGAVWLHLGVVGVAASMLIMRLVDFLVRLFPTMRRMKGWGGEGRAQPPEDLTRRMLHFAWQSLLGMAVTLVVWDRSEVFLLKHLSGDIRQVAFYSVAFSLAERLLIFPSVFASATGASVFAQYGRDRSRLPAMTAATVRYLGLTSIPLHGIAVALAGPLLLTMYGEQYRGAVLVATWAPLLCLPKAFLTPIQTFFESVEKQHYYNWFTIIASAVDIGVACWLIPRLGALGASIGSGTAQVLAVGALWVIGIGAYRIRLPWTFFAKVVGITAAAALTARAFATHLSPVAGLISGGLAATLVFLVLAWWGRLFEPEDLARLKVLAGFCPGMLAAPVNMTYSWLSRRTTPAQELP